MKKLCFRSLFLWILLIAGSACSQVIGEVRVEGTVYSDPAEILKVIQTPVGASLSSSATQRMISEDLKKISGLEKYDPLGTKAELRGPETLRTLVFIVKEYPLVKDIQFTGNTKFKASRLQTELQFDPEENAKFKTLFYRPALVDQLEKKLEDFYSSKGFSNVLVEGRVLEDSGEGVTLQFAIEEGRKLYLADVDFEGNEAFTKKELSKEIKTKPRKWLILRNRYDEEKFTQDIDRLKAFYLKNGYLEANVEKGTRKLVNNDKRLLVNFKVKEGPQYRMGSFDVNGNKIFDRSEILSQVTIQHGQVLDRIQIAENLQAIRSMYWYQGYRLVEIEPEIIPDRDSGLADIRLAINEGPRMRLGKIRIEGVSTAADDSVFKVPLETKDYVIEREFLIQPGEVLDWSQVEETERKLINLQFFESDPNAYPPRLKHGFQLEPIAGSDQADLLLQLEETYTGFFNIGAGFSTDYGPVITLELKDRNAFGRGWRYGLQTDLGDKRSSIDLSFTNPRVNNTLWSNSYNIYYTQRDPLGGRDFSEERIGAAVSVGRLLRPDIDTQLTYRLERVKIGDFTEPFILRDPDDVNATLADLLLAEQSSITSSIAGRVVRDTRDYVTFPTKGVRDSVGAEIAGFGGDNKFTKLDGTFDRYLKLKDKLVLAFRGHGAVGLPYGDMERIPLHERFFLGGSQTVRGFRYSGISPAQLVRRRVVDIDGNEIIRDDYQKVGGEAEWFTNLELRYLVNQWLQPIAFVDAGDVYEEPTDFGFSTTRAAIGAGLRINVYQTALIRLDLGFPIAEEEHDETRAFQFSFGANF